MRTLGFYTRLYFLIVSQYIKARMQFRTDFIISSVGMLFENVAGVFSLWILFKSIPNLEGWNYYELIFIYAFTLLALTPRQLFFDNIWALGFHLREGSFIKYYFRPLNMMFYYMSEVFDLKGLSQLLFGICAFVYSSVKLGLEWDIFKVILLLFTLLSSSLIMTALLNIAGSTAFWTTEPFSILMFTFRFSTFARYPITIFNRFLRILFTYVIPISFMAFYPSQLFLRPGNYSILTLFSPLAGVVLFIIGYAVWSKGVNSYCGTGS